MTANHCCPDIVLGERRRVLHRSEGANCRLDTGWQSVNSLPRSGKTILATLLLGIQYLMWINSSRIGFYQDANSSVFRLGGCVIATETECCLALQIDLYQSAATSEAPEWPMRPCQQGLASIRIFRVAPTRCGNSSSGWFPSILAAKNALFWVGLAGGMFPAVAQ